MANAISLHETFLDNLDEIYTKESLTSVLDTEEINSKVQTGKKFHVDKISMSGQADYNRSTGYVSGDVTIEQEEKEPNYDRGRRFQVDTMDDLETSYNAFGKLGAEYERTKVIPELDAFRLGKYASKAGTKVAEDLTADTFVAAIDTAEAAMIDNEVPDTGNYLFINSKCYGYLKQKVANRFGTWTDKTLDRTIEMFDNMPVIRVPQGRFNDTITLGSDGYSATGKNINFMIVNKTAVMQFVKHVASNVISPEDNQTADAYIMKYRNYALADVYDNKTKGIYCSTVTA